MKNSKHELLSRDSSICQRRPRNGRKFGCNVSCPTRRLLRCCL